MEMFQAVLFPRGQGKVEPGPLAYDPDRASELIEEVYPGGQDGTVVLCDELRWS